MTTYSIAICFVILTTQLYDANAISPVMKPLGKTLELEPGESLDITCVSSSPIKFIQPRPKQFLGFKSSTAIVRVNQKSPIDAWIGTLQKPTTNIADGGFYGCANEDVKVDANNHNQTNIAWIEVMIPNW